MFFDISYHSYDVKFMSTLRKCGKLSVRLIRLSTRKDFLLKCKHTEIYPNSFYIKSPVNSVKAKDFVLKLSKKFISFALDDIFCEINNVKFLLHYHLSAILPYCVNADAVIILKTLHRNADFLRKSLIAKYTKKFNFLRQKSHRLNLKPYKAHKPPQWIYNLSDYTLSKEETALLSNGLNFSLGASKIDIASTLAFLESGLRGHSEKHKTELRKFMVKSILVNGEHHNPVNNENFKMLKNLKSNTSIVIIRADKGNRTVLLNKTDYLCKVNDILNDGSSFLKLNKDITSSVQSKLNNMIAKLLKNKEISEELSTQLRCYTALCPPLYGLPKIHKDNCPVRPIVNFKRSPLYNLSSFLAKFLKPFIISSPSFIDSPFHFLAKLKKTKIPSNYIMVSFDVVSLYTSIPIDFALTVVKKMFLDLPPSEIANCNINPHIILELLDFCLLNNSFTFNNNFFKQIKGTAMGSPVSVPIAEIVMQYIESLILEKFKPHIAFWVRYVDDTFTFINPNHLNDILNFANNINNNIQFTYETENKSLQLPFLDVFIIRHNDSPFQTFDFSVYRKPTHSGQYLNFNSNNPISHKRSVIRSLCNRANIYCSNNNLLKSELRTITNDLVNNDYPRNFIRNYILKFFAITNILPPSFNVVPPSPPKSRIVLPYYKNFSESISHFCNNRNIQISFKPVNKIKFLINQPYPSPQPFNKLNVVYIIPCENCNSLYHGETGRTFNLRLKEHKRKYDVQDLSSKLVYHCVEYGHRPDWENTKIIKVQQNNIKFRRFLEGWLSSNCKDSVNDFDLPPAEYKVLLS